MHLVQTDADVQRAHKHLESIGQQSGLGVMCLGELTKQGSVCYALVMLGEGSQQHGVWQLRTQQ